MPELDASLFSGETDRGPEAELRHTEVSNFQEGVNTALTKNFKWNGKAMGIIGLTTGRNNLTVEDGRFIIRGTFTEAAHKLDASAIWEEADPECFINLKLPKGDVFTFSEGGLYSDFIPSSQLKFQCLAMQSNKELVTIAPADYTEAGVGEFAVRIICQISRASTAKKGVMMRYVIQLYPGSLAALTGTRGEQGPSWPGIKIGSGEFPLGPKPRLAWRCPILPFIKAGTPFTENPVAPSGDRLRRAISSIMNLSGKAQKFSQGQRQQIVAHKRNRDLSEKTNPDPVLKQLI